MVRANRIAMIFQDALSRAEPGLHGRVPARRAVPQAPRHVPGGRQGKAVELLDLVKIPAANQRVNDYPHQFSGGMRQRVMIAMALALDPEVLIADEPTTALDVTVQAQIMKLLADLQAERNMGLILITHDMGVVADVADRISVMYAGRIVEEAPVNDIYARPSHPYTKALLESIPRVDLKGQELNAIKGLPPSLTTIPAGCAFNPRCRYVARRMPDRTPRRRSTRWSRRSRAPATSGRRSAVSEVVLETRDLVKHFPLTRGIVFKTKVGEVRAVDGVNLQLQPGRDARRRG